MRTILLPTAVGACLVGLLGSFVTYAPGYEVAGPLLFIVVGAAAGFVSGAVSYLVARTTSGRPK